MVLQCHIYWLILLLIPSFIWQFQSSIFGTSATNWSVSTGIQQNKISWFSRFGLFTHINNRRFDSERNHWSRLAADDSRPPEYRQKLISGSVLLCKSKISHLETCVWPKTCKESIKTVEPGLNLMERFLVNQPRCQSAAASKRLEHSQNKFHRDFSRTQSLKFKLMISDNILPPITVLHLRWC